MLCSIDGYIIIKECLIGRNPEYYVPNYKMRGKTRVIIIRYIITKINIKGKIPGRN